MNGIHFGLLLFIRLPAWQEIVLFFKVSRQVLRPTQTPIQWVTGALSQGVKRPERKIHTHLHLVQRLRISGGISPVPYMPSWRAQEQLYLTLDSFNLLNSNRLCKT
jgi:hypothetical protein